MSTACRLAVPITMAITWNTESSLHTYNMFANKDLTHPYIAFVSQGVGIAH